MRGGSKPGERRGGRQKGTPNKRSKTLAEAQEQALALIEGTIPGAFEGNAHALLMAIYKNPQLSLQVRLDAAKAAIAYEKPRLASKTHQVDRSDPLKALFAQICGTAFRPVGDVEH